MKMRWLAAGIAAVLITGGGATVAQRIITQKTRGVLPETNDAAHPDSRQAVGNRVEAVAAKVAADPQPVFVTPPIDQASSFTVPPPPTAEVVTAAPLAAEPAGLTLPDQPSPQPVAPTVAVVTGDPDPEPVAQPVDRSLAPAADSAISPATVQNAPEPPSAPTDPVQTVDTFVERNRKEAEAAIQALSSESANLKARLTKVEAALTRWQSFSHALNADQPAAQPVVPLATKPNWKRPSPEQPPQPTRSEGSLESPDPSSQPSTVPPAAEVSTNPPLPSPAELPPSTSAESAPEAKPPGEPPPGLPEPKV